MKQTSSPDTRKDLYAPMLSIGGGHTFERIITDGLWSILSRARLIAKGNKDQLIQHGYNLTLPIDGKLSGNRPVTFVIYHVPFDVTQDKSIGSFDVTKIDHSKIKHFKLVRWAITAIRETVPQAEIVICTDQEFGNKLKDLNPTILIPKVERNRPMYYRARTYNTIIQNRWTNGVTIFLDSDAIVLKNPSKLAKRLNFKVGVTARFAPNLMPINEGVIICESQSQECIDFFAHYMGTYQWVKDDKAIQQVTGNDLMRWRGGQLSLNAICSGSKMTDFRDSTKAIKILPCRKYNQTVTKMDDVNKLKAKNYAYIAHVKGKAKLSQ